MVVCPDEKSSRVSNFRTNRVIAPKRLSGFGENIGYFCPRREDGPAFFVAKISGWVSMAHLLAGPKV